MLPVVGQFPAAMNSPNELSGVSQSSQREMVE